MTRAREQAFYGLGKVLSLTGDSAALLSTLEAEEVCDNYYH